MDLDSEPIGHQGGDVVAACAEGRLPPNVALVRLAMLAKKSDEVTNALLQAHSKARGEEAGRLAAALALWRANPGAFALVKDVLRGVEHDGTVEASDQGLAEWARTFDRLAAETPEGGVALYALGDPRLLDAATEEVVERLGDWGLLMPGAHVLEIGCGIGRFVAALAPRVGHVTGLDLSSGMIARARTRCAGLPNVRLATTDGRDLSCIGTGAIDLVLAADVFPYLVQSGLAETHIREAARVLSPGGHLAILNYSYRGDDALDLREVAEFASASELALVRGGARDFALWDAAAFVLRRS